MKALLTVLALAAVLATLGVAGRDLLSPSGAVAQGTGPGGGPGAPKPAEPKDSSGK